jgi:CelD/BcsL family acetyltransferase involved in cellulose biosynthesis
MLELLRRSGEAQITTIDGRIAAIVVLFWNGSGVCTQEWAHDPEYESLHLGFISLRAAVTLAIERGARTMDLLWGNEQHKERFGARHVTSSGLSVFPSQTARLHSLGEARDVASRRIGRAARRRYWQARHQAGRLVRGAAARTRGGREKDQTGESE